MRASRLTAAAAACVLVGLIWQVPLASAARVLLLGPGGHARVIQDRFLTGPASTPIPARGAVSSTDPTPAGGSIPIAYAARRKQAKPVTVESRLAQLERQHAITAATERGYLNDFKSALAAEKRLPGTRASELIAVTETLHDIAASGELTTSRLPVLFLTLQRNLQWWTRGPLLASGDRVEFAGSQLVWEYYPGQGIELQELGSFGKADAMYTAGPSEYGELKALVDELIPLAADRAGGLAWEYYFSFDGGQPPWVSAMAQGTALEALTRAYKATGDNEYLEVAHEALPLFESQPPQGVSEPTQIGTRFLQYSFAPHTYIINAFLQTLIGLYDYAKVSDDPEAQSLFAAGNREAQAELPSYDTGAWSLYQPGIEDDLSYHELVTGFLQELCSRTHATVYCVTAQHFQAYLHTPPQLTQLTLAVRARRPFDLRFRLSKISHVGIVVLHGDDTVLATSADFPYGVDEFAVPALKKGTYTVHLAATDLAGNFNRIVGTLSVGSS